MANFFKNDFTANSYDDGYAVSGSTGFVSSQNYLSDVGAYSLATSPYGTFDQGGNVWEWNETAYGPAVFGLRGLRGGGYASSLNYMRADGRLNAYAGGVFGSIGFRVATVPEPSTILLAGMSAMGLLMRRQR